MDVKLPNLGEGADSGTVVSILVKPGAPVKKGQNLIELETGKAVVPIPAPASGTVGRVAVKEGDKLAIGQLILVLEGAGTPAAEGAPKAAAAAPAPKAEARPAAKSAAPRRTVAPPVVPEAVAEAGVDDFAEEIVNEHPAAGPYVRRMARDLGIDLRGIAGGGRSGQVVVSDLKDYVARLRTLAARPRPAPVPGPAVAAAEAPPKRPVIDFAQWGPVVRKPMTQLRRTIAARMVESATTLPTVTQFDEADVTVLNELRKAHGPGYEAQGTKLTLTSFAVKAIAATLRRHPLLNASLDEASGEIVLKDYVHIGLAVDTEAGLLVPVIRDADRKDLLQLSREIQDLAARARERKLGLAELQGGTFTLSNQGGIGGAHFTPILNPPEVAILGLGRSVLRPAVHDGQIVPRLLMPMALTYDHRLIDGGSAARFITDLAAAFEAFREADIKL
jgi:pyruvate dehydrogenase E2 component (dihydrolipoamide acetyltransferase)